MHLPAYEDGTECSETSAYKLQTPGNYPEENIQHSEHGRSLKSRILHLYREKTARHIWLFKKLRIKKTKLLTSLTFLLRCRDHNNIPRFLQFHHHTHSRAAKRIYQHASFALLQERIHHNRWELDNTSRELLEIHLRLASVLSKSDWSLIDQLKFKKATRAGEDRKARQLRKFAWLHKTQHPTTKTSKETVINLSDQTWTPQSSLWRWCPGIVQTSTNIHIFLFWWTVLWTNGRGRNGLTTFSGTCEFLHGGFWEERDRTSATQTCMLVQLCRWYFRHLAPWPRKIDRISEPPQQTPQQDTVYNGNRSPLIPGHWHLQKNGWLPRAQSI